MLLAVNRFVQPMRGEQPFAATVRFRTIGDATCTGWFAGSAAIAAFGRGRGSGAAASAVFTPGPAVH